MKTYHIMFLAILILGIYFFLANLFISTRDKPKLPVKDPNEKQIKGINNKNEVDQRNQFLQNLNRGQRKNNERTTDSKKRQDSIEILKTAARCYQHIEELKNQIPPEGNFTFRQLGSLQKMLFERDWIFASWVDPTLKAESAEEAFLQFQNWSHKTDWRELCQKFEKQPKDKPKPTNSLSQFFKERIADRNPGYRDIFNSLEKLPDTKDLLFTSDLLSDAWTFVALRTEIHDLRNGETAEIKQLSSRMHQEMKELDIQMNPESFMGMQEFDRKQLAHLNRTTEIALETYDQLFSWRFKNIHGISNSEAVMEALSELEMRNVMGKDVRLPYPGE